MKKLLCSLVLLFTIFTGLIAKEGLVSFTAGITSGIPFYGSDSMPELAEKVDTDYRVIIGTFANINLNVIKQISFFTGADLLADFNWQGKQHKNHLHIDFPLGFKILLEYNFAHEGKSKYLPTIGGSWNLMPRGNNSYDNIITFYLAENF